MTDFALLADQLIGIQEDLPSQDDRDALGHAAHYLRALAAQQAWNFDMDAAPKDCPLLLVEDNGCVGEAQFEEGAGWYWQNCHSTDYVDGQVRYPIAWQRLPPAPSAGRLPRLEQKVGERAK